MARPTIFKKGAMTAAERQRRHRAKVRKQRRQDETAASRARNNAKLNDPEYRRRKAEADRLAIEKSEGERQAWSARYGREPLPEANGAADELARQIDEWLAQNAGLTIADVRAAINRRFGAAARPQRVRSRSDC
jgi:hypothetical protein